MPGQAVSTGLVAHGLRPRPCMRGAWRERERSARVLPCHKTLAWSALRHQPHALLSALRVRRSSRSHGRASVSGLLCAALLTHAAGGPARCRLAYGLVAAYALERRQRARLRGVTMPA